MELPTGQPDTLKTGAADLGSVIGKIVTAVSPAISQDLEKTSPGRPRRVQLLNQGIIATRSHGKIPSPAEYRPLAALATTRIPDHKADAQ